MNAYLHGRTSDPPTWEECERSVTCITKDPEVMIRFRPGTWMMFVRQFLSGLDEEGAIEEDFLATMEICS